MIAGEKSVVYADRSGDAVQQIARRTTFADALHQAGRRTESRRLFENAESRHAVLEPKHPKLYSLPGFRYCDLLLSDAERAAWRRYLFPAAESRNEVATCDFVIERAGEALRAALNVRPNLLIIGLNHLILARAALFKAGLTRPLPSSVHNHINAVFDGLRAAGSMDHLPRGLLTRAWIRALSGDEPGCRADLEEASEIVERGPMPLFQADVQLTHARIFHDRAALAEARRLIEKHGYHRRDGELADAEEAAERW